MTVELRSSYVFPWFFFPPFKSAKCNRYLCAKQDLWSRFSIPGHPSAWESLICRVCNTRRDRSQHLTVVSRRRRKSAPVLSASVKVSWRSVCSSASLRAALPPGRVRLPHHTGVSALTLWSATSPAAPPRKPKSFSYTVVDQLCNLIVVGGFFFFCTSLRWRYAVEHPVLLHVNASVVHDTFFFMIIISGYSVLRAGEKDVCTLCQR